MEKVVKTKNKILSSAIFLSVAGIITKIIGVLYKVPLLEIVGSEGLGYYQLVFPVFVFMLILSSGGITTTLSKIIAKTKNVLEQKAYLKICLFEGVIFSGVVSGFLFVFCDKIAYFQGSDGLCLSYKILCLALISCVIISSFRGYFQGLNNMKFTAWSQIIEQVGKISLGLLFSFIFIKESVIKSIFGAFLGLSLAEVICAIFLIVLYILNSKNQTKERYNLNLKPLFKIFNKELFPITLTALIAPLFSAINSLLIIDLLSKSGISVDVSVMLFGLSGVVLSLVGIPSVVSSALSTTIFPQICSKEKTDKEKNKIIEFSYKLIFAITIPCVFVFVVFSKPIVSLLYSEGLTYSNINQLEISSHILKLVSMSIIYSSLSNFTTMLLQAKNKSFKACSNLLFGSIIALVFFVVLTPNPYFNILGDSLSALIGLIITSLLNLRELTKENAPKVVFKDVLISPIVSSLVMIFTMLILYNSLSGVISAKIVIIFSCIIGFVIYMLMIFALKVFTLNEIGIFKPKSASKSGIN